jgi:hypothetical protein
MEVYKFKNLDNTNYTIINKNNGFNLLKEIASIIINDINNFKNILNNKRQKINNEFVNVIFADEKILFNDEDINNMLNEHPDIIQLFNVYYPELNFEQMNSALKKEILQGFFANTLHNLNNLDNLQENININIELADKYIPEMLLPTNLIYLNGKINNIPIKILVDTGATTNCIFKSKIISAGLDDLVDKDCKSNIQGINSNDETYGKIWCTEIELENKSLNNEKIYEIIRLNLQIINDDNNDDNYNKNINENYNENYKKFDVILGLNFLKSYKANIDFATSTITLNNAIKIKYD